MIKHYENHSIFTMKHRAITISDEKEFKGYTVTVSRVGTHSEANPVCQMIQNGGIMETHIGLTTKTIKNLAKLVKARDKFLKGNTQVWEHKNGDKIIITDTEFKHFDITKKLPKTGWLKNIHNSNGMVFRTGDSHGFGFCGNGAWTNDFKHWSFGEIPENWVVATDSEVKEMLVKEAKKRGFVSGAIYNYPNSPNLLDRIITGKFTFTNNQLCSNGYVIMDDDGSWAEVKKD